MKIAILGTGYVGLVTGACLAKLGHTVACIDNQAERVASLDAGVLPFFEPGLEDLVAEGRANGRLSFSLSISAVADTRAAFIAVGTPPRPEDGHADLTAVHAVARAIGGAMAAGTVIVTKSTVPVGSGDEIEKIIASVAGSKPFSVVSNPEFLREGSAVSDFLEPERIVVGCDEPAALAVMEAIYASLVARGVPLISSSRRTAELSKYAANAFLAMKVAFVNEMADLCERAGGDIHDVARIIGSDSRIGAKFLRAGPGFGGSCFPKDTLSLIKLAREYESPLRLIESTIDVNMARRATMVRKIAKACGGDLVGRRIGVWGLTFKADTDDMRESPAIGIVADLNDAGASVRAFDPQGMAMARAMGMRADLVSDAYDAARGADALVIITEWKDFAKPDFARLKALMDWPTIVDLRNVLVAEDARASGFSYTGIGLGGR